MSVVQSFPDFEFDGIKHTFEYLLPFTADIPSNAGPLVTRISFQSHVFSVGCTHKATDFDFRDEGQNKRYFCPVRHVKSQSLPRLCLQLFEQNALTWEEQDKNRVSNLAIIDGPFSSGTKYLVVYYLFPSLVPGIHVEMVVKSAYDRFVEFSNIKRKFNIQQLIKTCHFKGIKVPK